MSIIKKLTTAILLFLSFAVNAQQSSKLPNSLLWRISGKGLSQPSYLFGTMHSICEADYIWTDSMEACFSTCHTACFEMDLDDPQLEQKLMTSMSTFGMTIIKKLTKKSDAELLTLFSDTNLLSDTTQPLGKFLYVAKRVDLKQLSGQMKADCEDEVFYEKRLMGKMKRRNGDIMGLESVDAQLAVLNSFDWDSVLVKGMDMIRNPRKNEVYPALAAAYKQQNVELLYSMVASSVTGADAAAALLDSRNKKWIPLMGAQMKNGSTFFGVGAGHLAGKNGVINLLRKEGYTVTPVL